MKKIFAIMCMAVIVAGCGKQEGGAPTSQAGGTNTNIIESAGAGQTNAPDTNAPDTNVPAPPK